MAVITIGISDMNVVKGTDSIITYALGSCVGIALYDNVRKIAGLAHIMMPSSADLRGGAVNPMKYVDTAVPELLRRMTRIGAMQINITAKVAGGAQMFSMEGASHQFNIGERNIQASKEILHKLGLRIVGHDVGANYGRTVELFAETGIYRIKAIAKGIKDI